MNFQSRNPNLKLSPADSRSLHSNYQSTQNLKFTPIRTLPPQNPIKTNHNHNNTQKTLLLTPSQQQLRLPNINSNNNGLNSQLSASILMSENQNQLNPLSNNYRSAKASSISPGRQSVMIMNESQSPNQLIYKDHKLHAINKMLETTNDLKDRTIRELRNQVMEKGLKIDKLKNRFRALEADIAEFINEFDKIRQIMNKNGFLATATTTNQLDKRHSLMSQTSPENNTNFSSPMKMLNIKKSTQLKLMRYSKEQQEKDEKTMKMKGALFQTIEKLDIAKIKEDILVSTQVSDRSSSSQFNQQLFANQEPTTVKVTEEVKKNEKKPPAAPNLLMNTFLNNIKAAKEQKEKQEIEMNKNEQTSINNIVASQSASNSEHQLLQESKVTIKKDTKIQSILQISQNQLQNNNNLHTIPEKIDHSKISNPLSFLKIPSDQRIKDQSPQHLPYSQQISSPSTTLGGPFLVQKFAEALKTNFTQENTSHEILQKRIAPKEKETIGGQLKKLIGINDVSAARSNMFSLNRNLINLYLGIKRFKGENKQQNLQNFNSEFKYCLNLLMNIKDIMDFMQEIEALRTIKEIHHEIRLYLHTYFNCQFTLIMTVQNPFILDTQTRIHAQASNSSKFECSLADLGQELYKVIRDKTIRQVTTSQEHNEARNLEKVLRDKINLQLINYSAYPIVVQGCCQFLVVMCKRKPNEQGSFMLSNDELKLVNFITFQFQQVAENLKSNESVYNNKFRYQQLSRTIRKLARQEVVGTLIFETFRASLKDLFPNFILEVQVFTYNKNRVLEKIYISDEEFTTINVLSEDKLGLIYECSLTERDIYVSAKSSQRTSYTELVDLLLEPGYSLLTVPLISQEVLHQSKEDIIGGDLIGVCQLRLSDSNFGVFKSDPINRDILAGILDIFTTRYLQLT